jgi:hypothetical protein
MTQTKIEQLKALKEEVARTQARLSAARKLVEAAEPTHLATLLENDLEQAELVLAAKDIMTKLQEMAEDLAKINAQSLFPLVDKMKPAFGLEAAHQFEEASQEAVTGAMDAVRNAKDLLGNAIIHLEGRMPANDMAATDDMAAAGAPTPDMGMDTGAAPMDAEGGSDFDQAMDDFGAADGAAGPEEEPLGRAKKESVETSKASLNESAILKEAGAKLLVSEGLDNLIDWVLSEAANVMLEEQFRGFAKSVAKKAAQDPEGLAGWIGKKKHGMAAMAQLATPTLTASADLSVVEGDLSEGKTYKRDAEDEDEDSENWNKKHSAKDRRNARRSKNDGDDNVNEEILDEKFKGDDEDEDDLEDKRKAKGRSQDRRSARRNKYDGDSEMTEAHRVASAMAKIIEANILTTGKGKAVEVMNQFAEKTLSEGSEMTVLEAFEDMFGMKPAAFSVMMARELSEATPPMSTTDKKNAAGVMGKLASNMTSDKAAAQKPVSTAMAGMSGAERSTAQKIINQAKKDGKPVQKVGDFVAAGQSMLGDEGEDQVNENINAAHWPTDTAGQYKGEPFSTDYQKLKAPKGGAAKTEKAAPAKSDSEKSAEPKAETSEEPKAEKPKGNPFAKKEEASEEPKKVEESRKRLRK